MYRIRNLALVATLAAAPLSASAFSSYLSTFNSKYGTSGTVLDSCSACHGSGGTSTFNPYGSELRANIGSGLSTALTLAEPKDSDGDTFTNLAEITARTLPGDASSLPVAAAPKIAVAPASLAFGTVTVGSSGSQTATVSNTGNADLAVSAVSRCNGTSAEFTASPAGPFTVAPGGTQTLTVTYAPTDATADLGCIQIANDDATAASFQLAVSGSGQSQPSPLVDVDIARLSVAKRLDVSRGGTAAPKVAVVNAGSVAGTVTVQVEGSVTDAQGVTAIVYSASQDVPLAPAASAKVTFPTYAPAEPGVVTWTATVTDQNPDVDASTATTKVVP